MDWLADLSLAVLAIGAIAAGAVWLRQQQRQRRARESSVQSVLEGHFAPRALAELTVIGRVFPLRVRADLQRELEAFAQGARVERFLGAKQQYSGMGGLEFAALMSETPWGPRQAFVGPPQYDEVDVGDERPVRCLTNGIWLLRDGDARWAVLAATAERHGQENGVRIEVATPPGRHDLAEKLFARLEAGVAEARSYRGKVLSLQSEHAYSGQARGIMVHRLRKTAREEIILPERTIALIERNVVGFARRRDQLAARGQSLRKGVLLYGPPGTGKTHTIHWLASAMPDHTVLLVTAEQAALIDEYIALARLLQPSVVVLEDVDLIARERTSMRGGCEESLLNKLLNEMDGLRADARIIFVLTTNRPQQLEPALAGRPGRVDQAIEFPLPDADCRSRLVALYARDARLDGATIAALVARTEGASAAFIKELVRRAVQAAIDRDANAAVGEADLEEALQELLRVGGSLNAALLGAARGADMPAT
jgi:hypothetical protein